MPNPVLTFHPFTSTDWARLKAIVKSKAGVDLESSSSDASRRGVKLAWDFNEKAETLTFLVRRRSFFDPGIDDINRRIALFATTVMKFHS